MVCRIIILVSLLLFLCGQCSAQNFVNEVAQGRLIVGDTISVVIENVPEMSGEYTVDDMGRVDLPYIGKVAASGQDTLALAVILEELYKDAILVDPSINVSIFAKVLPDREIVSYIKPYDTPEPIISEEELGKSSPSTTILLPELTSTLVPEPVYDAGWAKLKESQWSYEGEQHSLFVQFLSESKMTGSAGCGSFFAQYNTCLLYTSPSPRDLSTSRMPSSA